MHKPLSWLQTTAKGLGVCLCMCSAAAMHIRPAAWEACLAALLTASRCHVHRNLLKAGGGPRAGRLAWHRLKGGVSGSAGAGSAGTWPATAGWASLTAHQHASMRLNACVLLLKCRRMQQLSSHACQDPA